MPVASLKRPKARAFNKKGQAPRSGAGLVARVRLGVLEARASLTQLWSGARQWAGTVPVLSTVLHALGLVAAVITPLGRWCLLALVVAVPTAVSTRWQEAWAVALVAGVLLLVALPTVIGRRSYQVEVALASGRVTVGDTAIGEVKVTNPTSRTVAASTVELPVGAGVADFRVPRLAAKALHSEPFTIPTLRRGVIVVGPVSSVRGDSVGLLRRKQRWNEPIELYVHPRTTNLDSEAIGFIRDIEGAVTQDLSSSDVSFHALRDYVPGDDRRNVHWRSTARTGRLVVRQFEETRRAHLLVVLDLDASAWGSEAEFETAVSCAASLMLAAHRAGRELSLVTQVGSPVLPTAVRALDVMAGVEPAQTPTDLGTLARQAANEAPQASVAVIITGSRTTSHTLHRAHLELPGATYAIGLRVDTYASLGSSQVGGMRIFTVESLDSLPLAMRRAAR